MIKHTLWARAGVTLRITEQEIEELKTNPSAFGTYFQQGKIVFDGEVYFPNTEQNERINGDGDGEFTI